MKKILLFLLLILVAIFPNMAFACSVPPDILHEWKIDTQQDKLHIQYSLVAWKNLHKEIQNILEKDSHKTLNKENLESILQTQIIEKSILTLDGEKLSLNFLSGSIQDTQNQTDYSYAPETFLTASFEVPITFDLKNNHIFRGEFDKSAFQKISPLIHPYIITDIQQNTLPERYLVDKNNVPYDFFIVNNEEIVIKNDLNEGDTINTFELFIGPKSDEYRDPFNKTTQTQSNSPLPPKNETSKQSTLFQVGETLKYYFAQTENTGIRILGLLIALAVGMFHGLLPGHSKTILGTYMMSNSLAKTKEVLLLIGSVAFSHTFFIFFLATIIILLNKGTSHLVGYIAIFAAIAYILFGIYFVYQGSKQIKILNEPTFFNQHKIDCNCFLHRKPSAQKTFFTGILAGCYPCIDALALFILALQAGDIYYGIAMIVAFSLGLGIMLGFLAFSIQYSKIILQNKNKNLAEKISAWVTIISGILIILFGLLQFLQ